MEVANQNTIEAAALASRIAAKRRSLGIDGELRTEPVAVVDSREQRPVELDLPHIVGTLQSGDYSLKGLEHEVALERKSLPDLLGCIGASRERFERELERLLAFRCRAVVCECTWADLLTGNWRGSIKPSQATGSVLAWMSTGIPFLFVNDHQQAGEVISRILRIVARRRLRELSALLGGESHG